MYLCDCGKSYDEPEEALLCKGRGHAPSYAELKAEVERLGGIVEEVNAWAVCGGITSAEDMAQNLPRIEEITRPCLS